MSRFKVFGPFPSFRMSSRIFSDSAYRILVTSMPGSRLCEFLVLTYRTLSWVQGFVGSLSFTEVGELSLLFFFIWLVFVVGVDGSLSQDRRKRRGICRGGGRGYQIKRGVFFRGRGARWEFLCSLVTLEDEEEGKYKQENQQPEVPIIK